MITHAASRKQYTVLLDRPEGRAIFLQLLPHFGKAETGRTGAPQCAAFNSL